VALSRWEWEGKRDPKSGPIRVRNLPNIAQNQDSASKTQLDESTTFTTGAGLRNQRSISTLDIWSTAQNSDRAGLTHWD